MAEEDFPTYRLLQPELMTGDELVNILRKNNVKLDFKNAEIGELVEIYRRVALPLPQRTYGSSWRERLLAKKQNRRKISLTEESKESSFSVKRDSSVSSSRAPSRPTHDRLKPPLVSSLTKDKKIIKLSSSSSSSKNDDAKVRTSSESSETEKDVKDKTEPAKKRKRITIDFSDNSEKSTPLPKVVISKRTSDEKSPRQPVSKHRRIVI